MSSHLSTASRFIENFHRAPITGPYRLSGRAVLPSFMCEGTERRDDLWLVEFIEIAGCRVRIPLLLLFCATQSKLYAIFLSGFSNELEWDELIFLEESNLNLERANLSFLESDHGIPRTPWYPRHKSNPTTTGRNKVWSLLLERSHTPWKLNDKPIFSLSHRLTTSGSLPGETQGSGLHRACRAKAEVSRPMAQPVLHSSKGSLWLELYGQTGHQSLATSPTYK